MTIIMNTEDTILDEVVITGLGTSVKRRNLANAVATVSSEELVGKTNQGTVDGALWKNPWCEYYIIIRCTWRWICIKIKGNISINGNNLASFLY